MSNSYKKTPIMGIACCASEKDDKRIAHRIARRSVKQHLNIDAQAFTHIDRREFRFNNVVSFGKDGKHYYGDLRHNEPDFYRKLNRK